jgi:rhodanese-related sulfurtransferase
MTTNECGFTALKPQDAKRMLDEGRAILIDIRNPDEFAREHITGARLVPLPALDTHDFDRERAAGVAVIFQCQSGRRTEANAARLVGAGFKETFVIDGGLNAWRGAGLPLHVDRKQPIDLQRQVQIAAGSLVLAGVALAAVVSPWFILLSGFVGGGLVFAGASGSCAMAQLLMLMPWNKPRAVAA